MSAQPMRTIGVIALACYVVHAGVHILTGHAAEALWACHVATLLVGIGALCGSATLPAIGVSWLAFGNPLWLLDLATGGELVLTSPLTHVGGLIAGLAAVRRVGFPRSSWWKATLGFVALLLVTRATTPRAVNVNLAFAVASGWEPAFPSYPAYLALLLSVGTGTFFVCELVLARHFPHPCGARASSVAES